MDGEAQRARQLMRSIDACYTRRAHRRVLDLEAELECLLWTLEHRLEALDEDEELQVDDGDPDAEAGVEEQFVRLWYAYVDDDPSFGGDARASEEHLLDVLESACLSGMAPHHLKHDALPPLLPVAAELARDRQALIDRYRAHSRRFGRSWQRVETPSRTTSLRRQLAIEAELSRFNPQQLPPPPPLSGHSKR